MLVVSLCKPVLHNLKTLGGAKLEHYKSMMSMGETTKRGGKPNFEFSVGRKQKGGTGFFTQI